MIITAQINDRAQPLDRGALYEEPLNYALQQTGKGEVTGGGTQLSANGEVAFCELEIRLEEVTDELLELLKAALEKLGAPKGSKLIVDGGKKEVPFGKFEGLAIYLNGTDLPEATYRDCDVNFVYSEFDRLLNGIGRVHSHWAGSGETALYLYGASFEEMRSAISVFINSYPLCEKARVVQIV